jgi:hypothetical protein
MHHNINLLDDNCFLPQPIQNQQKLYSVPSDTIDIPIMKSNHFSTNSLHNSIEDKSKRLSWSSYVMKKLLNDNTMSIITSSSPILSKSDNSYNISDSIDEKYEVVGEESDFAIIDQVRTPSSSTTNNDILEVPSNLLPLSTSTSLLSPIKNVQILSSQHHENKESVQVYSKRPQAFDALEIDHQEQSKKSIVMNDEMTHESTLSSDWIYEKIFRELHTSPSSPDLCHRQNPNTVVPATEVVSLKSKTSNSYDTRKLMVLDHIFSTLEEFKKISKIGLRGLIWLPAPRMTIVIMVVGTRYFY